MGRASCTRIAVGSGAALVLLVGLAAAAVRLLDDPVVPEAGPIRWPVRPTARVSGHDLSEPMPVEISSVDAWFRRQAEEGCAESAQEFERELQRAFERRNGRDAAAPTPVARPEVWLRGGDATGGEGNIDASAVVATLRSHIGPMRACYAQALRGQRGQAGRIELRFTVGPGGRVIEASSSGIVLARELGQCMTDQLRRLVFPAPEGGTVEFSFPYLLCP